MHLIIKNDLCSTWCSKPAPVVFPGLSAEVVPREPAELSSGLNDCPAIPLAQGWNFSVMDQDGLDPIHIHVWIVRAVMGI